MRAADQHRVPAGSALAVDREAFAAEVTRTIEQHPNIESSANKSTPLPDHPTIIATGPLTGSKLAEAIAAETGQDALAFFDAIAPIVHRDSIDMDVAWMAARWDKGGKDYINCPLDKPQYEDFVAALIDGEKMPFHDWEKDTPYFEGCMPIEVMAERGPETLRYGPMKGVGLDNPRTGRWPYAVVQLRQDNALGTLWNMVGFQTKLKHGEQVRIFRTIPGLENAEFARLGGIHRNSFINSPKLLDGELRLKSKPNIRFAGQITGCEGYVESAAVGLVAARFAAARAPRREAVPSAARRDRAWRPARPHHRRRRRRDLPADERQFRPDAAAPRPRTQSRPQEGLYRPRTRGLAALARTGERARLGRSHQAERRIIDRQESEILDQKNRRAQELNDPVARSTMAGSPSAASHRRSHSAIPRRNCRNVPPGGSRGSSRRPIRGWRRCRRGIPAGERRRMS